MCLSIPGKILELIPDDGLLPRARVAFGEAVRDVVVAYTPAAKAGDYVLVHVGFAITVLNEEEARKVIEGVGTVLFGGSGS